MHFSKILVAAMVTAINPVIGAPTNQLQQTEVDRAFQVKQAVITLDNAVSGPKDKIAALPAPASDADLKKVNEQLDAQVRIIVSSNNIAAVSINAQLSGGLYDATQGQVNDLMDALTIGQKGLKALSETLINCAAMEKSAIDAARDGAVKDKDAAVKAVDAKLEEVKAPILAAASTWVATLTTLARSANCNQCRDDVRNQLLKTVTDMADALKLFKAVPKVPTLAI